MDPTDLNTRFSYHRADEARGQLHNEVRGQCLALAQSINASVPEGHEKALAITNLEQVMFWANAAIARQP